MDIHSFYADDPRRRESDEVLFGAGWTSEADPHATYRLSWVVDTGELFTVREPHAGGLLARYLDELHLAQAEVADLTVEVLATGLDEAGADALLTGWQEAMGADDSLSWLHTQVATA